MDMILLWNQFELVNYDEINVSSCTHPMTNLIETQQMYIPGFYR